MKFTRIKRTLCFALVMAMLMAFVPMSAMAADGDPQTITANADTYIRQNSSNSDNALTNYSDGDLLCEKNGNDNLNNRYGAWPMVQFDLSKIVVPSGYEIDTAKINMYVKSAAVATSPVDCYEATVEPTDYSTVTWSSYATQLGSTDGLMAQSPAYNDMVKLSTATLDGEITDGEAYEFDVTSAVKNENNAGLQTFVFYTTMQKGGIYFYSVETEAYAPTVTVTFKKVDAPKTITANADTYVRGNTSNQEAKFGSEKTLYCTRDGDASKLNAYCSWPLIQYNLADIAAPQGYEIDSVKIKLHVNKATDQSAKVTCYMSPVEPTDYATATWSTYATQLGLTAATMKASPINNGMSAICEVQFDGEITDGEAYEFDVTDAVLAEETLSNQTFVFYTHNSNKPAVYFHSLEADDQALVPTMTVTYKEITGETITAIDTMWAGQNGSYSDTDVLSLQNNGTSASNRLAYIMFNAKNLNVTSGKVITEAKLRVYVSANYYYGDYSAERYLRIANVDDDTWLGPNCAWDEAPGTDEIRQGDSENGITFSGIGAIGAAGSYYDFDVTEYFTEQYYKGETYVSFAAHLDQQLKRSNDTVAAIAIHGALADNPPKLVVTYGEEADLAVTGVSFAEGSICKTVSELGAGYATNGNTKTYANVAMSGASSTANNVNLFLAQYDAEGNLVGVNMREFEVYGANGTVTHSFVPASLPDTSVTKAYVWNSDMSALLTTPATINTVENVLGEQAE